MWQLLPPHPVVCIETNDSELKESLEKHLYTNEEEVSFETA